MTRTTMPRHKQYIEHKAQYQKTNKEYYLKNKERLLGKMKNCRWIKYGLTKKELDNLEMVQNYVCAICFNPQSHPKTEKLCIDHCHATKNVRGLLCDNCNRGLGNFKDDVEILNSAIKYLKKSLVARLSENKD